MRARVKTRFLVALLAGCMLCQTAAAQQAAPAPAQGERSPRDQYRQGEACQRRTDNQPGVVKVDACGRWYCGRVDVNDITVLNPRFAEEMGCTWRLVEKRCKCVQE